MHREGGRGNRRGGSHAPKRPPPSPSKSNPSDDDIQDHQRPCLDSPEEHGSAKSARLAARNLAKEEKAHEALSEALRLGGEHNQRLIDAGVAGEALAFSETFPYGWREIPDPIAFVKKIIKRFPIPSPPPQGRFEPLSLVDEEGNIPSVTAPPAIVQPAAVPAIAMQPEASSEAAPSAVVLAIAMQPAASSGATTPAAAASSPAEENAALREEVISLRLQLEANKQQQAALEAALKQQEIASKQQEEERKQQHADLVSRLSQLTTQVAAVLGARAGAAQPAAATASPSPSSTPPPPAATTPTPMAWMPPPPPQTYAKATAASAASAPGARAPPHAAIRGMGTSGGNLAADLHTRRCVRVKGPKILRDKKGPALSRGLEDFFRANLGVKTSVSTATTTSNGHYLLEVASIDQATALVKARHLLKDTGYVVFDVLSPQEQAAHDLLWPTFLAARKAGHTAQFNRAQLYVTIRSAGKPPRRIAVVL